MSTLGLDKRAGKHDAQAAHRGSNTAGHGVYATTPPITLSISAWIMKVIEVGVRDGGSLCVLHTYQVFPPFPPREGAEGLQPQGAEKGG
jgi:hypothetical protein